MMLLRAAQAPTPAAPGSCPKCGTKLVDSPEEAQQKIQDLENQVKALNEKAALTVDKLADYEDEVQALKAQCARLQQQTQQPPRQSTPVTQITEVTESPTQQNSTLQVSPPRAPSRLASLSSFFTGRQRETATTSSTPTSGNPPPLPSGQPNQSTPNLVSPPPLSASTTTPTTTLPKTIDIPPTPAISLQSLQTTLESERSRRLKAETSLTQTQTELEELTAQLFGQANEMVAAERKARYKLEERVKVLENRDGEKRRRLERLEKALQRIERVRGLVERRNTVNGYGDAANLDIPNSSEDGDAEDRDNKLNRTRNNNNNTTAANDDNDEDGGGGMSAAKKSQQKSKMVAVAPRIEVKRKAVGTGAGGVDPERDKSDRTRLKYERKGTV